MTSSSAPIQPSGNLMPSSPADQGQAIPLVLGLFLEPPGLSVPVFEGFLVLGNLRQERGGREGFQGLKSRQGLAEGAALRFQGAQLVERGARLFVLIAQGGQ